VLFLTLKQHQEVVRHLGDLARNNIDRIPYHSAGVEYTSLMSCFLLHNLSGTETLLRLADSFDSSLEHIVHRFWELFNPLRTATA